jgi:hypothetical protein
MVGTFVPSWLVVATSVVAKGPAARNGAPSLINGSRLAAGEWKSA